jgi:hypothetical protein
MVSRTGSYVLFNLSLWVLAASAAAAIVRRSAVDDSSAAMRRQAAERAILLWTLVSLATVFVGGRFFGHYFLVALPGLSLLGARGLEGMRNLAGVPVTRVRAQKMGLVLFLLFLFSFVRFHQYTAALAWEAWTGEPNAISRRFSVREQELAGVVDTIRQRVPPGDKIYVWGIYWYAERQPASGLIRPDWLTGEFEPGPSSSFWNQTSRQLLADLSRSRPRLILSQDDLASALPSLELTTFLQENYDYQGTTGPSGGRVFRLYWWRDPASRR